MGKWFLSGGGGAHQTERLDRHFAGSLYPHKPLLYIPIAMDADRYDDGFDWISRLFHPLGIKNIVMWTDVKDKTEYDLDAFSAVYIGGGNTFRLLKQFIESHFIEVLKRYAESGGVIYGGSAGAIILGKNIMTCSYMDRNACGLRDFNGLKLLGDYAVWCHYKVEHDPLIKRYRHAFDTPVIALPEETGIAASTSDIRVIGTKPARIFNEDGAVFVSDRFVL
ncbi:Peptidase E [Bacillus paralicheniformis]|uniref:peptidase E n=1 Tax=Bacillus paralicheniformis TaxID=1648923 RepID=UPI00119F22D7|nr:peptidase E [Bacillus paralicheniformis]TWM23968.1 Peptidase E [Bacillus paralicheniformis]